MISLLKQLFNDSPKIIILGFGKEGRSTYRLIRRYFPNLQLAIADSNKQIITDALFENDTLLEIIVGDNYLSCLNDFDLIIKSPGVKIKNPSPKLVKKITSQTDLFLQYYASQTIGVTGTKGKSTTASLLKHFIDACDKKALLIGNIGVPAFDMIDAINNDTIIVYELSAHQLEYTHCSPHIAVLLNVFPEHLDYFDNYESYQNAKFNVFRYQNEDDIFIFHELFAHELITNSDEFVRNGKQVSQTFVTVSNNDYKFDEKNNPLIGKHNLLNINIALAAVQKVGVNTDVALDSLKSFVSLPHRLENIGEFVGIRFVNDSISTIPQSAIAAVLALENVDTLILGGFDRGLDYSDMVDFLNKSDIRNFIFLGKAGDRIYDMFNVDDKKKKLIKVSSMENAFTIIKDITEVGSICLLSPAAASYDQFNNFEHRGDIFKMLAHKL